MTNKTVLSDEARQEIMQLLINGGRPIDWLIDRVEQAVLQSPEIQQLRKEAEACKAIELTCEKLPLDCDIRIELERDAGTVVLFVDGDRVDFPSDHESMDMAILDVMTPQWRQSPTANRNSVTRPGQPNPKPPAPLPRHALTYQQPSRQKDAGGELLLALRLSGIFLVVGMRATLPAHICGFFGNGHALGRDGTRSALAVSFSNDFGAHGNLPSL